MTMLFTTLAYCASFLASAWVIPVQSAVLNIQSDHAAIIFLAHGVRVLAFFFFGWRALAYLLPGKALMWAISVFVFGQSSMSAWSSIVSLAACLFAYEMTMLFLILRRRHRQKFTWQLVLFTGLIASFCNAVGLTKLRGTDLDWTLMATYIIGDMTGLCAILLALMAYFRWRESNRI